ncbi:MAG TPA: winged helix-turn-helix domain-containing protein [Candidatus Nanoarchaeia archaeon]|nr:winged helix-turn-helix domain-containing protein [Candidatus Nanoarchaeia archaeon]
MKPFEGLLGNNCELRMLEYLLPLDGMDFNITELAEEVGVSIDTTTRIAKKFVKWGILTSEKRANAAYYSINLESPIMKNIEQLNNILIETILGDEKLYEIHDYLEAQKPHDLADVEKPNVNEALLPNSDRLTFQSKRMQHNPERQRNY